jgi:hypothetical protein
VIENHRLCFDIAQILSVVLRFFFNKTWDYAVIWIDVLSNTFELKFGTTNKLLLELLAYLKWCLLIQ